MYDCLHEKIITFTYSRARTIIFDMSDIIMLARYRSPCNYFRSHVYFLCSNCKSDYTK